MRWTQHVERRTTMLRTAKPRGPDISTPISSLRRDDVADDGDKKARSPGRAWSKPLKPTARGMPGVSGEARGDYTRTLFYFACEAAGALKHPAFPAPSDIGGTMSWHHPGGIPSREGGACPNPRCRHKCVRHART